ncbi:MAG: glucose-6-phosphate dehydrogenase [Acidimicrobiia bacterium]
MTDQSDGASVALSAALVVFGATGDLATRKLYPALARLAERNQLPQRFAVLGVARTEMSDEDFARRAPELAARGVAFHYVAGSFDDSDTFIRLKELLDACDVRHGTAGNRLYYLATVPTAFTTVAAALGANGMAEEPPGTFRRLIIEKPFGRDFETARALDDQLHAVFQEHQIFRIDHYLAKETVQNILALRFANAIFEPLWNRRYVDHVELTVAESLGVGHRGTFYEQAGALRDIVQNHLLQVLALTAMEPPASFSADAVRDEKVKLLRSIRPLQPWDLPQLVVRGQYVDGIEEGEPVPGYRDEEGVARDSTTETYLALRLEIDNWRWAGVPFFVRTGKRLEHRVTEVAVRYKQVPFLPLPKTAVDSIEPNTTVVRIQPDEGIEVSFGAKVPGSPFRVRTVDLDFSYQESFDEEPPEAYERVLFDALQGDATLFLRSDEVLQSWRVVMPLVEAFQHNALPLHFYAAGSWGPPEADALLGHEDKDHWRTP